MLKKRGKKIKLNKECKTSTTTQCQVLFEIWALLKTKPHQQGLTALLNKRGLFEVIKRRIYCVTSHWAITERNTIWEIVAEENIHPLLLWSTVARGRRPSSPSQCEPGGGLSWGGGELRELSNREAVEEPRFSAFIFLYLSFLLSAPAANDQTRLVA